MMVTWLPDPGPARLPILGPQAHEYRSRPRMLFGMGGEGGEPIVTQARGLRVGRLSQVRFIISIPDPWFSLESRSYKGAVSTEMDAVLVGTAHPPGSCSPSRN